MDTSFTILFQNQINCKKVSFEMPLAKAGGNSKKNNHGTENLSESKTHI